MSPEVVEGAALPGADQALTKTRQRGLGVIAKAPAAAALAAFEGMPARPAYGPIRTPETGLVMVRGRTGGAGAPFNLGEMTVTRAAVRLDSGEVGVGYVAGRDKRHAEVAAVADAMLQSAHWRSVAETQLIAPLAAAQTEARAERARKAAATKVEFFTLVRTRAPK